MQTHDNGREYRPAWWIPGRHLRTLWRKFIPRHLALPTRMERWDTADGDFLDLQRLDGAAAAPRLLVLHGLEGGPQSHYARALLAEAMGRGWAADVLVFRSCGSEPNRALRSYHSGETSDLAFVVEQLTSTEPGRPLILAGVSLGGNVLLKWLGERQQAVPRAVKGAAALSVPFDLARGSRYLQRGFSRVYQAYFLRSLKRKALEKIRRFPRDIDATRVPGIRTIYDFDDEITGPVHGFQDAEDYYSRSSSIRWLPRIAVPTLLLSARDDPFLPVAVLDEVRSIAAKNPALEVEFVERGGHVGFVSGAVPWRPHYYAEWRAADFLSRCITPR